MTLLWQLIFNPRRRFTGWQTRTDSPLLQRRRGRINDVSTDPVTTLFPWNFPIPLLTALDVSKSMAVSSGAPANNALSDGYGCTSYSGRSRCGLEGLDGLMVWAVLTLAPFACSPQRLIFWHPKHSATFHPTVDSEPHLNAKDSTIILPFIHTKSKHVFRSCTWRSDAAPKVPAQIYSLPQQYNGCQRSSEKASLLMIHQVHHGQSSLLLLLLFIIV